MRLRIHIIINPGSGQPKPILHTLNAVFRPKDIDWDISLTKKSGDAERFARQAAESGANIVAAYGGDGTVMEVARGLIGLETPLAIIPGGTANLMAVELGIPKDLSKAIEVAADEGSILHPIDVGIVKNGYFLLRVGMGFSARKVEYADRKLKDRFGVMAYSLAAVKAVTAKNEANYRLTVDGNVYEVRTRACQAYNAGNMGKPGTAPVPGISVEDGLLDLLVLRENAIIPLLTHGMEHAIRHSSDLFYHWQGRQIYIESDPPQSVHIDGEIVGTTPIEIGILPKAIRVLAPGESVKPGNLGSPPLH
ncbi:MAG: diacylglycerol kinase family lipid kinase [Chloroflexota bacterium]|nr:MAG: diacylglycerol kinase family lipid kinase [Chloroflexota bacterium]